MVRHSEPTTIQYRFFLLCPETLPNYDKFHNDDSRLKHGTLHDTLYVFFSFLPDTGFQGGSVFYTLKRSSYLFSLVIQPSVVYPFPRLYSYTHWTNIITTVFVLSRFSVWPLVTPSLIPARVFRLIPLTWGQTSLNTVVVGTLFVLFDE